MATISGDGTDENLRGTAGEVNNIAGNDGNDTVAGRGKGDLLLGGKGNDTVKGANGHDVLFGGQGNDSLDGGNGQDWLSGDLGTNSLKGGNGNDTFSINAAFSGGEAFDTIEDFDVGRQLRKMTFDDNLEIKNAAGKEIVFQSDGQGNVKLLIDGLERALFKGSEGSLNVKDLFEATSFDGDPSSVSVLDVNGNNVYTIGGDGGPNNLNALPNVGTTVSGNGGDDVIMGGDNPDFLLGNGGDDALYGKGGNDTLRGGSGNDLLLGGDGDDTLYGDAGTDVFMFEADDGNDKVMDFLAGETVKLTSGGSYTSVEDGTNVVLTYGATVITFVNASIGDVDAGVTFL
jgi:Ca2+-binding RTX toxin-like protein